MLMHIMVQGAPWNVLEDHKVVFAIMSCHRPPEAPDDAVVSHPHHELHLCDEFLSVLHTHNVYGPVI